MPRLQSYSNDRTPFLTAKTDMANSKPIRLWVNALTIAGLLLLFLLGVGMRRAVLEAQFAKVGGDLPFSLESALHYRLIKKVYNGEAIKGVDRDLEYPDGIVTEEVYSLGDEYVCGWLAHLFPDHVPLSSRVRWIQLLWFCMGIPTLALAVMGYTRNRWAGLMAGAFYAVSLSAVIRSTSQELSRENFALPLLLMHMAFDALLTRSDRRRTVGPAVGSALMLALALMAWDMIQYYILLWVVYGWWSAFRRPAFTSLARWLFPFVVLLAAALLNPYLRSHGFYQSPVMLLYAGLALYMGCSTKVSAPWPTFAVLLLSAVAPFVLAALFGSDYGDTYAHFSELLVAKLRFLNMKPADPTLLTFNQRIMWVPALHSADIKTVFIYFPYMLLLTLISFIVLLKQFDSSKDFVSSLKQHSYFLVVSFFTFILFVRFHVYVALFSCVLAGLVIASLMRAGAWIRWVMLMLFLAALFAEAGHVLYKPERWGRSNVYYPEFKSMTKWLRENQEREPVLANFGVSSMILEYGNCPIVLHPKFEGAGIRNKVRTYGELLFKRDEKAFRDYMQQLGVACYVYSRGEFANYRPEWQMRYFVDALHPPEGAAARLFESQQQFKWFKLLYENRKYRVFRAVTDEDLEAAKVWGEDAERLLQGGDLGGAEEAAVKALQLFGSEPVSLKVLRHVGSLKDQGFQINP